MECIGQRQVGYENGEPFVVTWHVALTGANIQVRHAKE